MGPTMPGRAVSHLASFCLGGAAALAISAAVRKPRVADSDSASLETMMPVSPIRLFPRNPHLMIAFDTRTKNPLFVMERLTSHSDSSSTSTRSNKHFFEELSLLPSFRSRNSHYVHSGFDRGHMAPAADFVHSDDLLRDTFNLLNASPQSPSLNRGPWARLEHFIRTLAATHQGDTYVVTGPLWLPAHSDGRHFRYSYLGLGLPPSVMSVPTHFFKVVLTVAVDTRKEATTSQVTKFAAFVLPNHNDKQTVKQHRLVNYLVRLTDLEAVSGLEFFPHILGSFRTSEQGDRLPHAKVVLDALTDDVRADASKGIEDVDSENKDMLDLVPARSKSHRRKIQQLQQENLNVPITYQHMCKDNHECFRVMKV